MNKTFNRYILSCLLPHSSRAAARSDNPNFIAAIALCRIAGSLFAVLRLNDRPISRKNMGDHRQK